MLALLKSLDVLVQPVDDRFAMRRSQVEIGELPFDRGEPASLLVLGLLI